MHYNCYVGILEDFIIQPFFSSSDFSSFSGPERFLNFFSKAECGLLTGWPIVCRGHFSGADLYTNLIVSG